MLVFGTETHSVVQPEIENLCGWSELGSCSQLSRAAGKPGTSPGHARDLQQPQIALFSEVGREDCTFLWSWKRTLTEPILSVSPLIMLFSDLCNQKAVAHNPEGLHLWSWMLCFSMKWLLHLISELQERSLLCNILEREKPSGLYPQWTWTRSSNTHPSAGSSVTVPAGTRLSVCVHPKGAAMHSSCTAAEQLCPQGQVFFYHAAF